MNNLKIYDVCIIHSLVSWPELNGQECTILEIQGECTAFDNRNQKFVRGFFYKVLLPNEDTVSIRAINLRRKFLPSREIDTVVSWSDCAWSPPQKPKNFEESSQS
jgi:hypothetical protein